MALPIPLPDDRSDLRLSDADRDRAAEVLRTNFGEGRLTMVEMEERLETVYGARTGADLSGVFDDLPTTTPTPQVRSGPPVRPRTPVRSSTQRRSVTGHLRSYVLVNLLMVAIYLMTDAGGYFWPVWVIVPWGFGLAMHVATCRGGPRQLREPGSDL